MSSQDKELMKPYFLPLKKEYYLKFERGEQDCEIRPANHRGWNRKNIFPGRVLNISNGYGNHARHCRTITMTIEECRDLAFVGVPQWHIDAVETIYGSRDRWLVAYVR